jgi:agmatine/peptidylarginine deiminase
MRIAAASVVGLVVGGALVFVIVSRQPLPPPPSAISLSKPVAGEVAFNADKGGAAIPKADDAPPADDLAPATLSESAADRSWSAHEPPNAYDIYRHPTAPLQLSGLIPEWAPERCLVLAIKTDLMTLKPGVRDADLETIDAALDVTDVLLIADIKEGYARELLLEALQRKGLDRYLQAEPIVASSTKADRPRKPGRIYVVDLKVDTIWDRDYGPEFATTRSGKPCILDAMYRDVRTEPDSEAAAFATALTKGDDQERHLDDQLPTVLSPLLSQMGMMPRAVVVRPPIQLWGGDFAADSKGNGFLSTETLVMNGADEQRMTSQLKRYYDLSRVTYLDPLPGETIKHIDMFFRPADDTTFLLAEYPSDVPASAVRYRFMHAQVRRTLEHDYQILHTAFPDRKIIRVPMPPLEFDLDSTTLFQKRLAALKNVKLDMPDWLFEANGLDEALEPFDQTIRRMSEALPVQVEIAATDKAADDPYSQDETVARISAALENLDSLTDADQKKLIKDIDNAFKHVDSDSLENAYRTFVKVQSECDKMRTVLQQYGDNRQLPEDLKVRENFLDKLRRALEARVSKELEPQCIYHPYLNVVHLKGKYGEALLVPAYSRFRSLEPSVQSAFHKAYPNAHIVFIPCDELADMFGALHCITFVVPEFASQPTLASAAEPASSDKRSTP